MVELTQETKAELVRTFCMAHTCGLNTLIEVYGNQIRSFQHLDYSRHEEYVALLNSAFKELRIAESIVDNYDFWDNTTIYDINTKYSLGIDFEEEDRKLNEFLNNSNFTE